MPLSYNRTQKRTMLCSGNYSRAARAHGRTFLLIANLATYDGLNECLVSGSAIAMLSPITGHSEPNIRMLRPDR